MSCEGYNRPGDRYVLQGMSFVMSAYNVANELFGHDLLGSCGLEYNLVRVDTDFEAGRLPYVPGKGVNWGEFLGSSMQPWV